jgi:hypothetical protein
MLSILLAVSLVGLVKAVVLTALAALNALMALLATISVWKTYMVFGMKLFLTLLILIPVVGIVIYVFWGQHKVREA